MSLIRLLSKNSDCLEQCIIESQEDNLLQQVLREALQGGEVNII